MQAFLANPSNTKGLTDKRLLELAKVVGVAILREREACLTSQSNASVLERLAIAGELLKKLVDVSQHAMKRHSLRFLVMHMKNSLILDHDDICSALLPSYSKICLMICNYAPHLDLFTNAEWTDFLEFICDCLHASIQKSNKRVRARATPTLNELLECWNRLIFSRPSSVSSIILTAVRPAHEFLSTFTEESTGHVAVFEGLNAFVLATSVNDIDTAFQITLLGYDQIDKLLHSKSTKLKQAIYLFICYTHPVLQYVLERDDKADDINILLSGIFFTLLTMSTNNSLEPDDIVFNSYQKSVSLVECELFQFAPRGNFTKWLYVSACTNIIMLLLIAKGKPSGSTKRRKHDSVNSSHLIELCDLLDSYKLEQNTLYFQIICIASRHMISSGESSIILLERYLQKMLLANSGISFWAMVCCGSILYYTREQNPASLVKEFQRICSMLWDSARKKLFDPKMSTATTFLSQQLYKFSMVPLEIRATEIERYFSLWDTHTPVLSNSSLALCRTALSSVSSSSSLAVIAQSKLVKWLLGSWKAEILLPKTLNVNMQLSIAIAECLVLLCGYSSSFAEFSFMNIYSEQVCHSDLLFRRLFRIWRYLSLEDESRPELKTTTSIISGPVAVTNKRTIANHVLLMMKALKGFSLDSLNQSQALHCLISCLLVSDKLAIDSDNTEFEEFNYLFPQICDLLQEQGALPSNSLIRSYLYEASGILTHVAPFLSNSDSVVYFFEYLASTILQNLEISVKQTSDKIEGELVSLAGSPQLVSINSFHNLRTPDRLLCSAYVQRARWLIKLKLIMKRYEVGNEMVSFICETICRLSAEELILWMPLIIEDLHNHSSNLKISEEEYKTVIGHIGGVLFSSYAWKRSEIAITLVVRFLTQASSFWVKNLNEPGSMVKEKSAFEASVFTLTEDLLNHVSIYMTEYVYTPYVVKMALTKLLCTALKKDLAFKFDLFDLTARDQLRSLVKERDAEYFYYAIEDIADLIVSSRPLDGISLYNECFAVQNDTTIGCAIKIRAIWILAERKFNISWLLCRIVDYGSMKEIRPYATKEISRILEFFQMRSTHELFSMLMPDILRYWFTSHIDFHGFPFELCGYETVSELEREHFRSMLAYYIQRQSKNSGLLYIKSVATSLNLDAHILESDIAPICLALSLTHLDDVQLVDPLIENDLIIPLSSEVSLTDIVFHIMVQTNFTQIPDSLSSLEPYSLLNIEHWSVRVIDTNFIRADVSLAAVQKICIELAGVELTEYVQRESVCLSVMSRILNMDDRFVQPEEKYFRVCQAIAFITLSGETTMKSLDVLITTLKGLVPWISDPDVGRQVQDVVILVLRRGVPLLATHLKYFTKLFSWMIASLARQPNLDHNRVSSLAKFLKQDLLEPIGMIYERSHKAATDKKIFHVLSIISNQILGESYPVERHIDEQDVLYVMNSEYLNIKDIKFAIQQRIRSDPTFLLPQIFDSETDNKLLLSSKQAQEIVAGVEADGVFSQEVGAWRARVLGSYYICEGPSPEKFVECSVEDFSGKVVAGIYKMVVSLYYEGDIQMIAAARQSLQQLIAKNSVTKEIKSEDDITRFTNFESAVFPLPAILIDLGDELLYDEWLRLHCVNSLVHIEPLIPGISAFQKLLGLSTRLRESWLPMVLQVIRGKNLDTGFVSSLLLHYLRPTKSFTFLPTDFEKKREKCLHILLSLREIDSINLDPTFSLVNAVESAVESGMNKCAILLLELSQVKYEMDKRDILGNSSISDSLLSTICSGMGENDPDLKYVTPLLPTLEKSISVLDGYQSDWFSFLLQSAVYDDSLTSGTDAQNLAQVASGLSSIGMGGMSKIVDEWTEGQCLPEDEKYAYAWKLQRWDLPATRSTRSLSRHEALFKMFRGIHAFQSSLSTAEYELDTFHEKKTKIFDEIYNQLFPITTERVESMAIVRECETLLSLGAKYKDEETRLTTKFIEFRHQSDKWIKEQSYAKVEDFLTARQVCWGMMSRSAHTRDKDAFNYCLALSLADSGRHAWTNQEIYRSISLATQLGSVTSMLQKKNAQLTVGAACSTARGKIIWNMGSQSQSIRNMEAALEPRVPFHDRSPGWYEFYNDLEILCTLAEWSSRARRDSNEKIREKYLIPAEEILQNISSSISDEGSQVLHGSAAQVHHTFAVFCDQQLEDESLLEEYKILQKQCDHKVKEILALKSTLKTLTNEAKYLEYQKHVKKVTKLYAMDKQELDKRKKIRAQLLSKSIESYLLSIIAGDSYTEDTSRLFALWLAHLGESSVNKTVAELLPRVASIKFVPWVNQITSLLTLSQNRSGVSKSKSSFSFNVHSLVLRICIDHPHHSLYQILSLRMKLGDNNDEASIRRCEAGTYVWKMLEKQNIPSLTRTLRSLETLAKRTLQLIKSAKDAESNTPSTSGTSRRRLTATKTATKKRVQLHFDELPDGKWWTSKTLKELHLPPPSMAIPLRADCKYADVPTMVKTDNLIKLAGGMSRPMIVRFNNSDGSVSTAVIKSGHGVDDLRQDAIMEQVFEHVNSFLRRDSKAQKRNLNIRTYKVVPLSPHDGVIEFVKDAGALGDILEPLHVKYRPNDLTVDQAKKLMANSQTLSVAKRLEVYKKIESKLKPVMSKFFLENDFSPDRWFKTRTTYTRSSASASIIGYIMGLGDRHCRNIMLDSHSGEVIHIDLGIAFDQAKLLRIPETVPFRLTRDVVDGMGITGTDGTFSKCAELTLDVLRAETRSVTTIMNVLKYDPLYTWTLTPIQRNVQRDTSVSQNTQGKIHFDDEEVSAASEADQAVESVRRKLSKGLSSEAVVRELIQQASSPSNLSLLYFGWAPFL